MATVDPRAQVLASAQARRGLRYALPPDPTGVTSIDCSLYVLLTFADVGMGFRAGVRTAEQIRRECRQLAYDERGWSDVRKGDLLFFEGTYKWPPDGPWTDGHVASHIGISLGSGTLRMWDAHDPGGVQLTTLSGKWQEWIFEARRPPQLEAC